MTKSQKVEAAIKTYNAARAACFAFDAVTAATYDADLAAHDALLAFEALTDAAYLDAFSKAFGQAYRLNADGEAATLYAVNAVEVVEALAAHDAAVAAIDADTLANDALSERKWQLGSKRAEASAAFDAALHAEEGEYIASVHASNAALAALWKLNPTCEANAAALTDAANAAAEAEVAQRRAAFDKAEAEVESMRLADARVIERAAYCRAVAQQSNPPPSAYAAARAYIIGPVCFACDSVEADCRCSAFDGVYTP